MRILPILFSAIPTLLLISCAPDAGQPVNNYPPNVIIIFPDDLGYGDLSCYGHPNNHTPCLDRMAAEGLRFTSFYVGEPVCTPSRAALLTGKYPLEVGIRGNFGPDSKGGLSPDHPTLANSLKRVGYRTAAFGKWHLGAVPGFMPGDHGFDEYYGLLYSNDMCPPWVNTDRPLQLYRDDLPTDEFPVDQSTLTRRYTDEALRFISDNRDTSFFVYLPYAMPHLPIHASEAFRGTSDGGPYGDVIEEIDHNVGRILDALDSLHLTENTLVVFTSDNGPWRNLPDRMVGAGGVRPWHAGTTGPLAGAKGTTMEGGSRVPAIVRWPGTISPAQRTSQLASTLDLHATVLALAGADYAPAATGGYDLTDFLSGRSDASPREEFFYYFTGRLEGVRADQWKLRVAPAEDGWTTIERDRTAEPVVTALYNLNRDPYEQFDVAATHPEVVERLRGRLAAEAARTGARTW